MRNNFSEFDDFTDSIIVIDNDNSVVYKNPVFIANFGNICDIKKLKSGLNFDDLCMLSSDNLREKTPLDLLLRSDENFKTVCSFANLKDEYGKCFVYTVKISDKRVIVFRNIGSEIENAELKRRLEKISEKYLEAKTENEKNSKLREQAGNLALKTGIVNKIINAVRETDDLEKVISIIMKEIHNYAGAFKTYFLLKDKKGFKTVYSVNNEPFEPLYPEYEEEILKEIKAKNIVCSSCLKECVNTDKTLKRGVKRIIIPIHNKNKLLGLAVTFTGQKLNIEDNREILQSLSVQLSSAIIRAGLLSQLNKKNKKLQKALTDLKEAQMQLINTEKLASLGRLISGIAHEINTPLAAINASAGLISKILEKSEYKDTKEFVLLKDINRTDKEAVKRIDSTVKSLKKFIRLDEAEFQPANINEELDLTLKLTEHETKNIAKIERKYSELPPVMCSVNMLNQVFMNLIINACQSIKDSGREGKLTVKTSCSGDKLCVKIKDNGTGIPKEIRGKIFNAGFSTKEKGIGTGLGLAISKKIVEMHKGEISFKTGDTGTEFTVKIPVNSK